MKKGRLFCQNNCPFMGYPSSADTFMWFPASIHHVIFEKGPEKQALQVFFTTADTARPSEAW